MRRPHLLAAAPLSAPERLLLRSLGRAATPTARGQGCREAQERGGELPQAAKGSLGIYAAFTAAQTLRPGHPGPRRLRVDRRGSYGGRRRRDRRTPGGRQAGGVPDEQPAPRD